MKTLQIGVIGSMADLQYPIELTDMAAELGKQLAAQTCTLIFGAEKDSDSLPTIAARCAKAEGGLTIGITYDKGLEIYDANAASVVIATGLVRGGGREMVQALSCDGIIAIGGGSGTLNEMTVAYQANIPVVVMNKSGGWSMKVAGTYLDERRRYKYQTAKSAHEAIEKLRLMIESKEGN